MCFVLKVKLPEDVFRARLEEKEITHKHVVHTIHCLRPDLVGKQYSTKYTDEDGDSCTLCQPTFADFLTTAEQKHDGNKVLKLEVCELEVPDFGTSRPKHKEVKHAHEHKAMQWLSTPKKLLWVLSRLKAHGLLSNNIIAVIVVHVLPDLISNISGDLETVNSKVRQEAPRLKNTIAALMGVLLTKPDFDTCVDAMSTLLEKGVPEAGEVLLQFFQTVQRLQFSEQIEVISACAESLTTLLHRKLDLVDQYTPRACKLSFVHDGVACNGCGMSAIRGPRFTCRSCADFDLCGECFANKPLHHEFSSHAFDMQVLDFDTAKK